MEIINKLEIRNEIEVTDVPFYYMCAFAIIHEQVKRAGSLSYLSLYPCLHLYTLPTYALNGNYLSPERISRMLGGMTSHYSFAQKSFDHVEAGCRYLRQALEAGQVVSVQGTSYRLSYHDDFENPKYLQKLLEPHAQLVITDHWLTVYGMNEEEVFVYDPVPFNFKGPLLLEEFAAFWAGNRSLPELQGVRGFDKLVSYGVYEISVDTFLTEVNVREFMLQALRRTAELYLKGGSREDRSTEYFFGCSASRRLQQQIAGAFHERSDRREALAAYSKPLFDMRWSRYYMRDYMEELASLFGDPFPSLAREFRSLLQEWEAIGKLYLLQTGKKTVQESAFPALLGRLERLTAEEDHWYARIQEVK